MEMVNSVDDSKSSSSVRGIRMSDLEALDARIASALNRIIHNPKYSSTCDDIDDESGDRTDNAP